MTVLLFLGLLILAPAAVAFVWESSFSSDRPAFAIGSPVVYREEKVSNYPTPDACDIRPAVHGEFYYYSIINYLRVAEVLEDGRIVAVTSHNQRMCFWPNNSGLRKARLTERLIHPLRFPHL